MWHSQLSFQIYIAWQRGIRVPCSFEGHAQKKFGMEYVEHACMWNGLNTVSRV